MRNSMMAHVYFARGTKDGGPAEAWYVGRLVEEIEGAA